MNTFRLIPNFKRIIYLIMNNIDSNQFWAVLKAAREKAKKSQQDVADHLGMSQRGYAYYEKGDRVPDEALLVKLVEYLSFQKELEDYYRAKGILAKNVHTSAPQVISKESIADKVEKIYEERIKDLKEDKAFLQEILKTSLARIVEEQGTVLAYQKAWVDQHAEEKANGDSVLETQLRAKMSRRVGEHELGPLNKDKA